MRLELKAHVNSIDAPCFVVPRNTRNTDTSP